MSTVLTPKRPDGLLARTVFFEYRRGTDPDLPTLVVLPGIQDNPWAVARLIAAGYNVLLVHYPTRKFRYNDVAYDITQILLNLGVARVVIVGISLGGLLGCRLVRQWEAENTNITCEGLILWNAPRRISDLALGTLAIATCFAPGGLLDPWSAAIFAALGGKEMPKAIEPEANVEQIREDHAYGLAEQASAYVQKLRFILQSSSADFFAVHFLPIAYVISSDDEVVKPTAVAAWQGEFHAFKRIEIAGPHCCFSRAPARCEAALTSALSYLQR